MWRCSSTWLSGACASVSRTAAPRLTPCDRPFQQSIACLPNACSLVGVQLPCLSTVPAPLPGAHRKCASTTAARARVVVFVRLGLVHGLARTRLGAPGVTRLMRNTPEARLHAVLGPPGLALGRVLQVLANAAGEAGAGGGASGSRTGALCPATGRLTRRRAVRVRALPVSVAARLCQLKTPTPHTLPLPNADACRSRDAAQA